MDDVTDHSTVKTGRERWRAKRAERHSSIKFQDFIQDLVKKYAGQKKFTLAR